MLIGNRIEETEIFTARHRLGTLARFETWGGHATTKKNPRPLQDRERGNQMQRKSYHANHHQIHRFATRPY